MILNLTLLLSLASILNFTYGQQCCDEYCFGTDDERKQIKHFSTKTAYQLAKGAMNRDSDRQFHVPNCTPVKFWLLSRHGTRLPSAKSMKKLSKLAEVRDEIIDNYEKRHTKPDRGSLCEADLNLFRDWRWDQNATGQYSEFLTTQGWDDLKYLAKNYQSRFPNVLHSVYDKGTFLFRHTDTQRTEASYKAFVEGLFGDKAYDHMKPEPIPEKDYLLRPYDNCDAWEKQDDAKDLPDSEISKFMASDVFKNNSADISTRLGFKYTLSDDLIEQMWDMCRFEQAWYLDRLSAWCAAFTTRNVEVLEYKEDLKYYYKSGYGSVLNQRMACAAIKDMVTQLEYTTGPKTIAYFSHSSMVQLFLVALGAKKDAESLRADNFVNQQHRQFKTSELGPFTTNIAAVKYECEEANERHKVSFFLNEKPLTFSWCNVGLCNWSDVKERYKSFKDADCTKEFCGGSSGTTARLSGVILLVAVWMGIVSHQV